MSDPSTGWPTSNPVTFKWILQDDGNFCRYVYDLSGNMLSVVSTGTQGGKVSSHRHTIS
ncbi:MAG: hypothetical protein ACQUHE_11335 [Bacteroidia bacterium]